MRTANPVDKTFRVLNQMVRDGVISRYAVAGAVGALNYLEPITTRDVDILVPVEDLTPAKSGLVTLESIFSYLRTHGYGDIRDEGVMIEGWPVQFLPAASPLDTEGLDQAIETEIEGIKIRVLRPEHLVATSLKVGRPKDYLRIAAFFSDEQVDRAELASVFDRHDLWGAWSEYCRRTGTTDPASLRLRP